MEYNFDEIVNRRETNDLKWNGDPIKSYLGIDVREDMIPMWIADMDFKCPENITKAIEKRAAHGLYGYCTPQADYLEAIRFWMEERHGYDLDIDTLYPVPTVVAAINVAIRTLTEEGDGVIIQQPVYNPFESIINKTNRRVVDNTLIHNNGYYEIDFELLEEQAKQDDVKLMLLCSPHNPVGRVWTKEELQKVDKICRENGVFVLADEIHSDIVFGGNKHTVFSSLSKETEENTILCISPSKTFNIAGLKMANVAIKNKEIKEKFIENVLAMSLDIKNTFGIEAMIAAYSKESIQWLDQLLVYLEGNIDFVENYITENMPGIKLVRPEGTFLAWLDLSGLSYSDNELLKKFAIDAGVICVPGNWFGELGSKHMRLNIGTQRENLEVALNRLKKEIY